MISKILSTFALIAAITTSGHSAESSRTRININPVWRFHSGDPAAQPVAADADDSKWQVVSLPHSHRIFPADLSGFPEHGREVGWYRRTLNVPASWSGKKVFLEFQGAMQVTRLWVNGNDAGEYSTCGYDSFHFDITRHLKPGPNTLAVRVDNTSNPDVPPDGRKTDFMQFGGLYRDVHVVVTDPVHITFPWEDTKAGIRLTLPEVSETTATVAIEAGIRNESDHSSECVMTSEIFSPKGKKVATLTQSATVEPGKTHTFSGNASPIAQPELWSPDHPALYQVVTTIRSKEKELDRVSTRLGIRWTEWNKQKGFLLNGKPLKLVGANRHQTWPFIGNAVPNSLHRRDAEQLKEMGLNWVRCSHYPHDPDFLDALDELGIMALEEGPTWMERGGPAWMDRLEQSFRRMIRRDRNHPSLIIWNACVNHSGAEGRLVNAAKEEDPTRPRGQDNVPCPMNFSHKHISGNGALCIEHTGHTFDTERGAIGQAGKAAVGWVADQHTDNREYELTLRHWEHTDAAYRVAGNAGLAVWAMYDYNTFHNATAGIARHGVLDLFRIPKHSWWWHQSELTARPMAYIIRVNDKKACVLSNCPEVRLTQYKGNKTLSAETRKPDEGFVLHHPPYHFTISPEADGLKAEAMDNGKVKTTAIWRLAGAPAKLQLEADRTKLTADGADISRLIFTVTDANGTPVPNASNEVTFRLEGQGQLIGENPVRARAGKMIVLVRSTYTPGSIRVTANSQGLASATCSLRSSAPAAGVDLPKTRPAAPSADGLIVTGGATSQVKATELKITPKRGVMPDTWIESDPIMLDSNAPVSIRGGEYRVYTEPWSDKPRTVKGGDAIFLRVKSSPTPGGKVTAEITIGNRNVPFEVSTRP